MISLFLVSIFCFTSFANQFPIPGIIEKDEKAFEELFYYTESQYKLLLRWKNSYEIKEIEWNEKEIVYQESIKDLAKKTRIPFFKSFKFGVLMGISLMILSVWAVGQLD